METRTQYNSINSKIKNQKKNLFTSYDMMTMRYDVTTNRVMCMHIVLHSPCDIRLHVYMLLPGVSCTCACARSIQIINKPPGQSSASVTFIEQAYCLRSSKHHAVCVYNNNKLSSFKMPII